MGNWVCRGVGGIWASRVALSMGCSSGAVPIVTVESDLIDSVESALDALSGRLSEADVDGLDISGDLESGVC